MQKLEDELGVKLFDRQKNKLQLNATGILAAQYAARILSDEAEMEKTSLHLIRTFALFRLAAVHQVH